MILAAVYVVHAGLEPLGRVADIILPAFVVAIAFTLFLPLLVANPSNLCPVLYQGWQPVLMASLTPAVLTLHYAYLTIIVPSLVEPRRALRTALGSLLWAYIVLALAAGYSSCRPWC
ncbi:MAG: GerAB/ArcD/ProY family transporter [Dethiobacteria bacterium]